MMENSLNLNTANIPVHVGIIMDGNGRWAKQKNMIRTQGHSEGLKAAKKIVQAASDCGIKFLTLYTFSTENWKRTQQEVGFLMNLIHTHLKAELDFYKKNKIKIKILGDKSALPKDIQKDIQDAERDTENFDGLNLILAINYGGRDEITRCIKKLLESGIKADEVNEQSIASFFDIPQLPDADLIIRTGGEKRLSNFLMWQSAYSEFIFDNTLWPDYSPEIFYSNLKEFQDRNRRFGGVPV